MDAIKASKILGITLTKRSNGSSNEELAGFPHHALDTYLPKLVRAGERVAICDQLEDPKASKDCEKRSNRVGAPGVSYNDKILDHKSNNFLACVHFESELIGVSFLDISTGEFLLAQGNADYIGKLLQSFAPNEVLFQKQCRQKFIQSFGEKHYTFTLEDWVFTADYSKEKLCVHFDVNSLKGFGVEDLSVGTIAAGAVLHYLSNATPSPKTHLKFTTNRGRTPCLDGSIYHPKFRVVSFFKRRGYHLSRYPRPLHYPYGFSYA